MLCDIFDAPVFVPSTVLEAAAVAPGVASPPGAANIPSRAALGGAYLARWARGVGSSPTNGNGNGAGAGKKGTFEEDIRWILGKRWAMQQNQQNQHQAFVQSPGLSSMVSPQNGRFMGGMGMGSLGKASARSSGLAATALVEEDEEEGMGGVGAGGYQYGAEEAANTSLTSSLSLSSQSQTNTSLSTLPSTLSIPSLPTSSGPLTATPTTAAPLTPIAALQTDDADAQFGLVKVAEPDSDAFMGYAAMVGEYVRLEGLVVKGLV